MQNWFGQHTLITVTVTVMVGWPVAGRPLAGGPAAGRGGELLIVVASSQYQAALRPWLRRRADQGFRIRMIDPGQLGPDAGRRQAARWLRRQIVQQLETGRRNIIVNPAGPQPVCGYLLLVGDAPGPDEPFDPGCLIPGVVHAERANPDAGRSFVSDNDYGLPDEAGMARLAVGRWPVRNAGELAAVVAKTLRHETEQRPDPLRGCFTFLATTPNYDPLLDPLLERLAAVVISSRVGGQWGLRVLYCSPYSPFFPGPRQCWPQVKRWLQRPTPLTLFAGHGYTLGVDVVRYRSQRFRVLDVELADQLDGRWPGTVLWMSACSCGRFDLPGQWRCLAEALVLKTGGPVAVVAGSGVTSAYTNLLMCLGLARHVQRGGAIRIGQLLVQSKRAVRDPAPALLRNLLLAMERPQHPERLAEDHQYLYNLLGDPTLTLRMPRTLKLACQVSESPGSLAGKRRYLVTGTLDGWDRGKALVSLVLDRLAVRPALAGVGSGAAVAAAAVAGRGTRPNANDRPQAAASPLVAGSDGARPAARGHGPAADAGYLARFRLANDRLAAQVRTSVSGGRFRTHLEVPADLLPLVRWVRLYVYDEGNGSDWSDAVAAAAWPALEGRDEAGQPPGARPRAGDPAAGPGRSVGPAGEKRVDR